MSTLPVSQRPELITLVSRSEIKDLADVVAMNLKIKHVQADLLDNGSLIGP